MGTNFDNFIGGLAFGMLASNPFFRGMGGCCGFGFGGFGGFSNTVDFGTFANPFPTIFPPMQNNGMTSAAPMLTDFANPGFPALDFAEPCKTIWDNYINPDSEFNKRMREMYKQMEEQSNKNNVQNSRQFIPQIEFPFSSLYLSSPMAWNPFMPSYMFNYQQSPPTTDNNDKSESEKSVISYDVAKLKEKWSKKKNLSDGFYQKVVDISKKIKCDPNDLMGVMWYETAKTFDPSKTNSIGAVGLIQFLPDTAKGLGTTTQNLKAMSAEQQLDYVEKYLAENKKSAGYSDSDQLDRGTLYSLVFLPGRSKRNVLTSKGEKYYSQNPSLDYDKDGSITKSDLSSVVLNTMA